MTSESLCGGIDNIDVWWKDINNNIVNRPRNRL